MISAWKRLINRVDGTSSNGTPSEAANVPPGVQKLGKEIQRKFARGVHYNMKVVIRGDTKVGKTALFLRLKGHDFDDAYLPTENLQVTSIDWNYKATDEVVKIDLWEAVDATCMKSRNVHYVEDLKLENGTSSPVGENEGHLENNNMVDDSKSATTPSSTNNNIMAQNGVHKNPMPESAKQSLIELSGQIDVYKDANAVLLVMDITKLWTFKYVKSELQRIPKDQPVLVIANHQDQGHHRVVSREQVRSFIDGLNRNPGDGLIMYTDASMKNGFGLKMVEKFFSIPYLKLQEASLLKQLELNRQDYMTTLEELQLMEESVGKEYEQYLALETIRRRQIAESQSPINRGFKQLDDTTREQIRTATTSSETIGNKNKNLLKSIESKSPNVVSEAQLMAQRNFKSERIPSIVIGASCPLPDNRAIQLKNTEESKVSKERSENNTVVEGSFEAEESDQSDEGEPKGNPLVVDYQSDLDPDDQ